MYIARMMYIAHIMGWYTTHQTTNLVCILYSMFCTPIENCLLSYYIGRYINESISCAKIFISYIVILYTFRALFYRQCVLI